MYFKTFEFFRENCELILSNLYKVIDFMVKFQAVVVFY